MSNADDLFSPQPVIASVLSVSELNRRVRSAIEAKFELCWVAGELSNVMRAASGHWYFSLKDQSAQVRGVMFKQRAASLNFKPENGMQVEVRALPSLYEARGEFQLGVEAMRRAGLGALFEAYERLKARFLSEGLFDETRKRTLPAFPKAIGIITSTKAAALRDVITTLNRRAPMIPLILYPTAVQGNGAAQEIANAIDTARERHECEVLILCRGGGSIEDLWAFNEEPVARAIARLQDESHIVLVSGVGHETDFTIADFVADVRVPTPTAAAELVSPNRDELLAQIHNLQQQMRRVQQRLLDALTQTIDEQRRALVSPQERVQRERERVRALRIRTHHALTNTLAQQRLRVESFTHRLNARKPNIHAGFEAVTRRTRALQQALQTGISHCRQQLKHKAQALSLLNPQQVLERGYSIVSDENGKILRSASTVSTGVAISVRLAEGQLDAIVTYNLGNTNKPK